ncbi:MAG: hypothetical protein Kow0037_17230 [Calditrichia bacterium]
MMNGKALVMILLLAIAMALPAQNFFEQNSRYINVEVDRTPIVSGGMFLQDMLALEVGAGLASDGNSDTQGLMLQMGLDKYWGQGKLSTYVGGKTRFDINPVAFGNTGWKGSQLHLMGHWGVNYFILKQFSLAFDVGGELLLNSPKDRDSYSNFATFTSGIKFRFFF